MIPFDNGSAGRDMMLASKFEETMMDVDAAIQALKANGGRVAIIGFCWGGGLALRSAQVLNIACAVAFYGTRLPQYLDRPLKARYEGAGHAFANDARPCYIRDAAELAHQRSEAFLKKHLG